MVIYKAELRVKYEMIDCGCFFGVFEVRGSGFVVVCGGGVDTR